MINLLMYNYNKKNIVNNKITYIVVASLIAAFSNQSFANTSDISELNNYTEANFYGVKLNNPAPKKLEEYRNDNYAFSDHSSAFNIKVPVNTPYKIDGIVVHATPITNTTIFIELQSKMSSMDDCKFFKKAFEKFVNDTLPSYKTKDELDGFSITGVLNENAKFYFNPEHNEFSQYGCYVIGTPQFVATFQSTEAWDKYEDEQQKQITNYQGEKPNEI